MGMKEYEVHGNCAKILALNERAQKIASFPSADNRLVKSRSEAERFKIKRFRRVSARS
jgi:hypothetical protein